MYLRWRVNVRRCVGGAVIKYGAIAQRPYVSYSGPKNFAVIMAVDFLALRQNDFWKKKSRRACEVRDTNGDGYISRADFVQMADHLKKLNASTSSHL